MYSARVPWGNDTVPLASVVELLPLQVSRSMRLTCRKQAGVYQSMVCC